MSHQIFAGTGQRMAAALDVGYTAPKADGSEQDSRLQYDTVTGGYTWEVSNKQLTFQPTFMYRLPLPANIVPFAGSGHGSTCSKSNLLVATLCLGYRARSYGC